MDIIIRDVEEIDGQYKIYNKDGTGGHWYITKESAEVVEAPAAPQPIRFIECYISNKLGFDIIISKNVPKNEIHFIDEDGNEVLKIKNIVV
ncbi:MAG: hypothetical protein IPJ03_22245 [Ignavibacteriales bacterium]|nr:hypothetical protein [Ignavibacteriales bacterium]